MKLSRPSTSLSHREAAKLADSFKSSHKTYVDDISEQDGPKIKSFPHATPPKDYRINQQDVYNYVRNSIYETFKHKTSRNYDLVKQLTASEIPQNNQKIDRLCKKYSILKQNKKSAFQNVQVDIQEITNRYVKSKSKQKQKQQIKTRLKKDISLNYKFGPNKQYRVTEQFFSFNGNQLKNLQKRHEQKQRQKQIQNSYRGKKTKNDKLHPYLQLYERAQMEALNSIINKKNLDIASQYPSIPEPEQWEKNTHYVQKIFREAKNQKQRLVQSARVRRTTKNDGPDFFLS